MYLWGSDIDMSDIRLEASNGGNGGNGSDGQAGAIGGEGGLVGSDVGNVYGGSNEQDDGSNGAKGGAGGVGGNGGNGGGGCGGPSVGILSGNNSTIVRDNLEFSLSSAGTHGLGGAVCGVGSGLSQDVLEVQASDDVSP